MSENVLFPDEPGWQAGSLVCIVFEIFLKEARGSELESLAKFLEAEGGGLFVPVDEGFSSHCCDLELPPSLSFWWFSFYGKQTNIT